jgi:hypothetical protein
MDSTYVEKYSTLVCFHLEVVVSRVLAESSNVFAQLLNLLAQYVEVSIQLTNELP